MLFNILKKDLKRKKAMNFILVCFITLCTLFLASSVNNVLLTSGGIDYFAEQSNLGDAFVIIDSEEDTLEKWLDESKYVNEWQASEILSIRNDDIRLSSGEYSTNLSTALSTRPINYNLLLDENNEPLPAIEKGEIVIAYANAQRNELAVGDQIILQLEEEKTFTVGAVVKDMLWGSELSDPAIFYLSDDDFKQITKTNEEAWSLYTVSTDDVRTFQNALSKESFPINNQIDKAAVSSFYMVDLLILGIFIVASVFLIIISLIILRFTIVFTLQEDYKELGIMKAIGLKNWDIKKVYLIKYLFMALFGTAIGLILSFPFGNLLMQELNKSMALPDTNEFMFINFLCAIFVTILVITFCYMSTRKINKLTALQAIRSGETGERYKQKSFLKLHKITKLPTVCLFSDK